MRNIALMLIVIAVAVVAALVLSKVTSAAPCDPTKTDPRNCAMYGDSRDMWVQGMSFGQGAGDIVYYQEGGVDQPVNPEVACSNHHDDDLDSFTDF